jgi:hypothetical protein
MASSDGNETAVVDHLAGTGERLHDRVDVVPVLGRHVGVNERAPPLALRAVVVVMENALTHASSYGNG